MRRHDMAAVRRGLSRSNRVGLLCGVSAMALVMTGAPVRAVQLATTHGGGVAATAQVAAAALASAQQSSAVAQQTMSALMRANQAVQAMQSVQANARAAAANAASARAGLPAVPDGLETGGLVPDSGLKALGVANQVTDWTGASTPTQSVSNGQTSVNINQQAAQAILTWQTFNVGRNTTLTFNQQGNTNWVALNRVIDPSGLPSQILGQINATGQVYVINRNGIVFGGASQVNVGTLVASTADFNPSVVTGTDGSAFAGSDAYFMTNGIYSTQTGGVYLPSFTDAGGAITVNSGAQISTNAPASVTSGGGFVLMMGTQVTNAGTITTPDGQTELAAGDNFILRPGYSTDGNSWSTTRGNEIAIQLNALGSSLNGGSGYVANMQNGVIEAETGDITLAGETVVQDGALVSTTSVNTRGTIHLLSSASDPLSSVTLSGQSVTQILPDTSGATALNSQRSALLTDSMTQDTNRLDDPTIQPGGQFDDLSTLADLEDESRVEITSGGMVWFQTGSQTVATGGQISVSAVNRVQVDTGALLDVAGDVSAILPMSDNDIAVEVQGNELRDDPENRDTSILFDDTVYVDERQLTFVPASSTDSSDRDYTEGGVFEVSGWLNDTAHTIGEWLAPGGSITLSTGASGAVVAQSGAIFNISGGQIQYQSGELLQSYLMGADGNLYNANTAPSDLTYTGIYDGFTVDHAHWGVTQYFGSVLFAPSEIYEQGYTVGRDAGALTLSTPTAIFDATVEAGVVDGQDQTTARPATATDPYLLSQTTVPLQGSIALGQYNSLGLAGGYDTSVTFATAPASDAIGAADPISAAAANTANFDAAQISNENLGGLSIATASSINVNAPLAFAPGAHVSFIAPDIDIAANISAHDGSLSITNLFQFDGETTVLPTVLADANGLAQAIVEQGVTLDTSGLWVNGLLDPASLAELAFVNGGSVSIDMSQGVTLASGSMVDVSSGGGVSVAGATTGGKGGNVTLVADDGSGGGATAAPLIFDGDIQGYGVKGGGTLTISANQSIVFGNQAVLPDGVLAAGEAAPTTVTLSAPVTLAAGQIAPVAITDTYTQDVSGQPLPLAVTPSFIDSGTTLEVVGSQGWTVPPGLTVYDTNFNPYSSGDTVYQYTVLVSGYGSLPAGYDVPTGVFQNNTIPIDTATLNIARGTVLTQSQTLAAGTIINPGTVFNQAVPIVAPLDLNPTLLSKGFSAYDISSNFDVSVEPNTTLAPSVPVFRFTSASFTAPSGAAPTTALQLWTPPLYLENPVTAQLTPRAGASLSVTAGTSLSLNNAASDVEVEGAIDVGAGATINVDPGQSITFEAPGQITIDGTLRAPGGSISVTNTLLNDDSALGQSIWIGSDAILDVAGEAFTATDLAGQSYGTVTAGGSITLGYAGDVINSQSGIINSTHDFIIVQPGAVLDASGASASIDLAAGTASTRLSTDLISNDPVEVASNGGTISMSSYSGIYADGTMEAAAGGPGAAGGTFAVTLESSGIGSFVVGVGNVYDPTNPEFVPRIISIGQSESSPLLPAGLEPGTANAALQYGEAQFYANNLEAGGFANLSFTARDAFLFEGNVNLSAGESIAFHEGAIADTTTSGQVTVTAPYLLFAGQTGVNPSIAGFVPSLWGALWLPSLQQSTGVFTASADLIDIEDEFAFGIDAQAISGSPGSPIAGVPTAYDLAGFANVDLASQGDIRFTSGVTNTPSILTSGNIDFDAAQVYPTTDTTATVEAGFSTQVTPFSTFSLMEPTGVISIGRIDGVNPAIPDSVGGSITFEAATIEQGGIVRAPLGTITLGASLENNSTGANVVTSDVELLSGSVTSVSANGLDIPFGGTTDGVSYSYNGANVLLNGSVIGVISQSVTVDKGAVLDLSGGGTLAGAGFISGEGGSVDVLSTPLVSANPTNAFSAAGNAVYAIVPGYSSAYAPAQVGEGALPGIGQQITIPNGVPGLPAGTYTLLPAYYALLPGGYRIELGKTVTGTSLTLGTSQVGNGSYVVDGYESVANTSIKNTSPSEVIVTPGAAVLNDSDYDQEDYATYAVQNAATLSQIAPFIPADAGTLSLMYPGAPSVNALTFDGSALFTPAAGGLTGTVIINGNSDFEITAGAPTPGFAGYSFDVADIDAINAPTLIIGGSTVVDGDGSVLQSDVNSVTLRSGADLTASQVFLLAGAGGIALESGAEINTIGQPVVTSNTALGDADQIENFGDNTLLAVSNDPNLTFINPVPSSGSITIGAGAQIYSEGTIAFVTGGPVSIDPTARYGTRNLEFSVGSINIGTDSSLDGAVAPSGLLLTQNILDSLLAGDTSVGAPALQTLTLSAAQSVNFYGSVDLNVIDPATGKADLNLVLDTPAIYGFGSTGDTATLTVGTLTWGGVSTQGPNGLPVSLPAGPTTQGGPGTGAGTLDINANQIVFGFPATIAPINEVNFSRTMLGFSTVNLNASQEISSSGQNSLTLYQAQSATDPSGPGTGGNLDLDTPLLTGGAGSVMSFTAGGTLDVATPAGVVPSAATIGALGGNITLNAGTIAVSSTILLPSGELTLNATDDIDLQSGSTLDLNGQATTLIDQVEYSWGGEVSLLSASGNIVQSAGSTINVSAVDNSAGSIMAQAIGAGAGQVALDGTLLGAATVTPGANIAPQGGTITIDAQTLASGNAGNLDADFAALNNALNVEGFSWSRSFDLKQGDLTIGNELQAHDVSVSVDNGSLTVNGTINASGATPGSITLAAMDDLTLDGTLDAHGTVLQADSYGNPIDAENRAEVDLISTQGTLTIANGATINVSSPDPNPQGDIELDVSRGTPGIIGTVASDETAGNAKIVATGTVNIIGAQTIALNAFWTYMPTDTYGTIVQDNGDPNGNPVAQSGADAGFVGMDQINARSQAFMAAVSMSGLLGNIGGLTAHGATFHLRPGVEIESATADGTLTVAGDIDLSTFRYSDPTGFGLQVNPAVYGSGEPGSLIIRAGGDLDIVGSINDGFYPGPINPVTGASVPTPDDKDWNIGTGQQASATETLLPVTLESGTTIPNTSGLTLRYDIDIQPATINADTVIPVTVSLSDADTTIPAGTKLTAPILDANGNVLYRAGTVFSADTALPQGTQLSAGSVVPIAIDIAAMTWKAGTPLDVFSGPVTLSDTATVPFEGIIPAGANLVLQNGYAPTRPLNGLGTQQGINYAVAPLLPPGDLSWSIQLVAGADLKAADTGIVQPASALQASGESGNLTLTDSHAQITFHASYYVDFPSGKSLYTGNYEQYNFFCQEYGCSAGPLQGQVGAIEPSVLRTGTGNLDLVAGGSFNEDTLFGVYTAGTQSANVGSAYNAPRGLNTDDSGTVLGATYAPPNTDYESAIQDYQAEYPTNGGNLSIVVQGNLAGDNADNSVGNWLWHQTGAIAGQATAWWINSGTYTIVCTFSGCAPAITAFAGLGTLGGGNVTIDVGGNAGTSAASPNGGLDVAIGSTGRVQSNGTIEETGGGNLTINIGGDLNSLANLNNTPDGGVFTDLRGNIDIQAGAIGTVVPSYGFADLNDPRAAAPTEAGQAQAFGGIAVVPGDGVVNISTDGDIVLGGVGDATRPNSANNTAFEIDGVDYNGGDGFSLWTDVTAVNLFSAGGDLVPSTSGFSLQQGLNINAVSPDDGHYFYPSTLNVVAASGSIYFENESTSTGFVPAPVELMPSAAGELNLLAEGSIYDARIDISGANPSLISTPDNPAFNYSLTFPDGTTGVETNISPDTYGGQQATGQLIAFGADTATTNLHADDTDPAHIYAVTGDIVNLQFGEVLTFDTLGTGVTTPTWYVGAKAVDIVAGGDIVESGLPYSETATSSTANSVSTPGFILNDNPTDISIMSAGGDIIYSSLQIGGPGLLEVTAGGNIYEANQGAFQSIGPVFGINANNHSLGAGITVMAGLGADGPDYAAFANTYLNPSDPSSLLSALSDYGSIVQQNDVELASWLAQNFDYQGNASGAYAFFQTLPGVQQDVFLRQIFFEQLNAGGLDFTNPSSIHFKSYIVGQDAIATLFPTQDANGNPINYSGNITLFGASGIRTLSGGTIQTFTPGGETIVGVEGPTPPSTAGLLTQGSGDIDMYSDGSILLGESRILTTFGGNIVAWSATGDINAGRGAKTTQVFTPPVVAYDNYGDVTLSPPTPSSGAGIGTLAPIPSIPPGDINLIAPEGTVDAGEAGIRVSGNFNVAALHVVNTANIDVQGTTSGIPTITAPNVGALSDASAASGAATKAITTSAGDNNAALQPSILIVEIEGYGGSDNGAADSTDEPTPQPEKKQKGRRTSANEPLAPYSATSAVQVLGSGSLAAQEAQYLTPEEKQRLVRP